MKIKTKFLFHFCFIFCFTSLLLSQQRSEEGNHWVNRSIKIVEGHARNMLDTVIDTGLLPRSEERGLQTAEDWTSGFYPGILWYLYDYTKDDYWKRNAEIVTSLLEKEQYNRNDHDIGFRMLCSYGNGYHLTRNKWYKEVIIRSAESLSSRYSDKTKVILSWNPSEVRDWKYPVIIDNMMNLELLYMASELSGDNRFAQIASKHAITTMNCHFRKDYSCPHVVDYDPESGNVRKMDFNNGFSDPSKSAWSRGQAWALYGFTLMFRETKDKKFLDFAENIAKFILNHPNMPKDLVPYWDYNSPKIPSMRDASAAAINAAALLELSTYPTQNSALYFNAAEKTLKSLSSDKYLAIPGTNGNFAIKHATGNFLGGSEVDNTLVYADYYFLEALMRYLKIKEGQKLIYQYE